jgi:hypothetical protein
VCVCACACACACVCVRVHGEHGVKGGGSLACTFMFGLAVKLVWLAFYSGSKSGAAGRHWCVGGGGGVDVGVGVCMCGCGCGRGFGCMLSQ